LSSEDAETTAELRRSIPPHILNNFSASTVYVKVAFEGVPFCASASSSVIFSLSPNELSSPATLSLLPCLPNPAIAAGTDQSLVGATVPHLNLISFYTSWILEERCFWEVYLGKEIVNRDYGTLTDAAAVSQFVGGNKYWAAFPKNIWACLTGAGE
jgi:hypothetical protein